MIGSKAQLKKILDLRNVPHQLLQLHNEVITLARKNALRYLLTLGKRSDISAELTQLNETRKQRDDSASELLRRLEGLLESANGLMNELVSILSSKVVCRFSKTDHESIDFSRFQWPTVVKKISHLTAGLRNIRESIHGISITLIA